MKHLDLFSGIGGFSLAARNVWAQDHEIVSFCEIDKYCQKVLKKHWPDVPCHDDIKTLRGNDFGAIDLLTGGFPCQPFSVAGKQGGAADDRYLWPEMFRVIQEARPTWIIGENVPGIINTMEFEQCFIDLESEGYETQAFIIPACAKDAKHRRDRVWIVGKSGRLRGSDKYKTIQEKNKREKNSSQSRIINSGKNGNVANSLCCRREQKEGAQGRVNLSNKGLERKIAPDTSIKGLPEPEQETIPGKRRGEEGGAITEFYRWPIESGFCRVAHGIPSRVDRLKGLGNAIVPQVVMPIMQAIKEIENGKANSKR